MSVRADADDRPLRVLRVLTRANLGGPTRQAIALWHEHRRLGIDTLLVTGDTDAAEVALSPAGHGIPQLTFDRLQPGWLALPELGRRVAPLADRRAQRRLRELIRSFRPHVVHTHTSKAGLLGRRAALAERVPHAHTFHGHVLCDYFGWLRSRLLRLVERRLAAHTDQLFAVSPSCADELADLGIAGRERFEVIPPAVQMPSFCARDDARGELGIAADDWRVVAVGRLVPIKRFAHFVATVDHVPGLHGDLVGDGPGSEALRAAAGTGARVRLLGARRDIRALLPAYDALVLTSVREGCPLVAIEAFGAGVPVVGYDVPGVRDALAHYGSGELVPVHEGPAGLARALTRLRQQPGLRERHVRAAARAVATCAPASVAERLATAYRAIRRA